MRRNVRSLSIPTTILVAWLLATAAPAQAVFVETPLSLAHDRQEADVGDRLEFRISPYKDEHRDAWKGRTVAVRFGYDANERAEGEEDPDAPASNAGWTERYILTDLVLDDNARAGFSWTVPEEARDHNLIVTVEGPDGETLATSHLAIGDAPPQMHAMGGQDDGREAISAPGETAGSEREGTLEDDVERSVPGAGLLALVGVLALAAVALQRRR